MSSKTKIVCENHRCNWKGYSGEQLKAKNPFDANDNIEGCPECKDINTIVVACDEPDCWRVSTCGTPTENGYRRTCFDHAPNKIPKER